MDRVRKVVLRDTPSADGSGVRVAVLDTGIDADHPDLTSQLNTSLSCSTCFNEGLKDVHGHGTHVSGIIAGDGTMSNGKFRGMAPGVELIVFKVSATHTAHGSDVAKAVELALDAGADIINYSGGQAGPRPPPWKWSTRLTNRDRAFRAASEQGVLCVTAAGNQGPEEGSINRPGALPAMLCVGALGVDGSISPNTSRGPVYIDPDLPRGAVERLDYVTDDPESLRADDRTKPEVATPGGVPAGDYEGPFRRLIATTSAVGPISCRSRDAIHLHPVDPRRPDFLYGRESGTSQATAVVSGLAALALQYAREVGLDLGDNSGRGLKGILCNAARRLQKGDVRASGNGIPLWPHVAATIEDCTKHEVRRKAVIYGPQIEMLED